MKRNLRIFIYSSLFIHLAGGTALFLYYFSPSAPRAGQRETADNRPEAPRAAEQVLKEPEKPFEPGAGGRNIPMKTAPPAEDLTTVPPPPDNLRAGRISKPSLAKPVDGSPQKTGNTPAAARRTEKDLKEKTASGGKKPPTETAQDQLQPILTETPPSTKTGKITAPQNKTPAKKAQPPKQTVNKTPQPQNNGKTRAKQSLAGKTPPTETAQDQLQPILTETPPSLKTGKTTAQQNKTPAKNILTSKEPDDLTLKTASGSNNPMKNPPNLSSVKFKDFQKLKQKRGNPKLIYPPEARKKKIQGIVSLIYFVSPEGLVDKIQLTKSSGSSLLDNQTLRTLARYEFFPRQEGWVRHTVAFVLKGEEEQILKLRHPPK